MRDVLVITVGAIAFVVVVEWIVRRVRRRRPTPLGSKVSPRWLNDQDYGKDGDRE